MSDLIKSLNPISKDDLNPLTIQFLDGVFLRVMDYVVVILLGSVAPHVGRLVSVGTVGALTLPVVVLL